MSTTLIKPEQAAALAEQEEDHELLPETDPRSALIWINPARFSGVACFARSRVPLQILWDHLEEGESMDEFLDGFPGITHEQARGVLQLAFQALLDTLPESTPLR